MPCFLKSGAIEMKQSVLMGSLGKLGDQFVLEGYKPEVSFAEKIRRLSQIEDLQGVEFSCTGKERDAKMAASALADSGLVCSVPLPASRQNHGKLGGAVNDSRCLHWFSRHTSRALERHAVRSRVRASASPR